MTKGRDERLSQVVLAKVDVRRATNGDFIIRLYHQEKQERPVSAAGRAANYADAFDTALEALRARLFE